MRDDRFFYDGWDERKEELDKDRNINWSDPYCRIDEVRQYPIMFRDDGYGKYLETSGDGLYGIETKAESKLSRLRAKGSHLRAKWIAQYTEDINEVLSIVDPVIKGSSCREGIKKFIVENRRHLYQRMYDITQNSKTMVEASLSYEVNIHVGEVKRFITPYVNDIIIKKFSASKMIVTEKQDLAVKSISSTWENYNPFDVYYEFGNNELMYNQIIKKSAIVDKIVDAEYNAAREVFNRSRRNLHKEVWTNTYKFQYTADCVWANLLSILTIAHDVQQNVYCYGVSLSIRINGTQFLFHNINLADEIQVNRYGTDYELHLTSVSPLMYMFQYIADNAPKFITTIPMVVNFSWNNYPRAW